MSEGKLVVLASPRGFCAGVSNAIDIVNLVLERYGPPVYVRHEIVHNRYVVDGLKARGARFVEDPAEVPAGSILIFSAHGVSPVVREAARRSDLRVIDATCPLVTKVHIEALRYAREGYEIIVIGHRGHVEVEGTLGHAPERMHLVERVEDVANLDLGEARKVAVVTQTTLSVDDTREIVEAVRRKFPAVRTPSKDDICYATQNRQTAVKELSKRCELILVIGSPASSNANRLVEVARNAGATARLVESAEDISVEWIEGLRAVGVTAGASTPEPLVRQAVSRLQDLGFTERQELATAEENVTFALPRELREPARGDAAP